MELHIHHRCPIHLELLVIPQPEDVSKEEQDVDAIQQDIYLLNAYMLTTD